MPDQIISREGHDKLSRELEHLIKIKRREIAERIERAKELGDLSENAEYHEAKDAQAFNEGRINELETKLKNVIIVEENGSAGGKIGMGSEITVLNKQTGEEKNFKIVSFNEADPINGKISNESPLGTAFLDKKKGDEVMAQTPKGETKYKILKVK